MVSDQFEYDVFISYAIEDKISVVNELVQKLEECGIKVWYASQKLRVGYGVQETIKEGLNRSRHGILVLSHNYFLKEWPKKELHVLWAKESGFERRILPVWHNITEEEIRNHDPLMANTYGLKTEKGVDFIVRKLVNSIRRNDDYITVHPETKGLPPSIKKLILKGALALIIIAIIISYFFFRNDDHSNPMIEKTNDGQIEVQYIFINTHPDNFEPFNKERINEYVQLVNSNVKNNASYNPAELVNNQNPGNTTLIRFQTDEQYQLIKQQTVWIVKKVE